MWQVSAAGVVGVVEVWRTWEAGSNSTLRLPPHVLLGVPTYCAKRGDSRKIEISRCHVNVHLLSPFFVTT